jgi:ureidoacrylate peracid hydrolase
MSILEGVVLDPAECGLLVIDMQNGFCHPEGSRGKAIGAESVYKPEAIIPDVVRLMKTCREAGVRRWLTRQVYYPTDAMRSRRRIPSHLERRGLKLELTRRGTWDAELHDTIAEEVQPEDEIIVKHRASAFYNTSLEPELRMLGVQVLIIAGTTTSFCVDSTVRDAYARDFDVLVPAECVADTEDEAQEAVLHGINRFHGVVTSIGEVAGLLGVQAHAAAG